MMRREFIRLLGGAAAGPLAAHAQQLPMIGFLGTASLHGFGADLLAFHQGLRDVGYVENQNVTIAYRWAEGQNSRLPALAGDLVRRQASVIVVTSNSGALAAKAATASIPIVFLIGGDPIRLGLVASLNRPGGNITGIAGFADVLIKKRLELLHELVPKAKVIAVLVNPENPDIQARLADVEVGGQAIGQKIQLLKASNEGEIDSAFAAIDRRAVGAILVQNDPFLSNERHTQIIALAARYALPAAFEQRVHAQAGGLMSYGADRAPMNRQLGVYTGRVLKGEKPADLPVQQPAKFELVLNLKTAKALGLDVPLILQQRADEVIE